VPFHWKQHGEWLHGSQLADAGITVDRAKQLTESPDTFRVLAGDGYYRVGKHAAGRRLDGVIHDAFPEPK
jgi:hypothetical protein